MTAREKFRIGDRVRITDEYIAKLRNGRWSAHRTGRVVGFRRKPYGVRMVRDGCTTGTSWHMDDLEKWDGPAEVAPVRNRQPDLDRVARELVTALYLYSGYTVGSRGPSGCIMDALAEVAPDIAAEIRDGEEPGDIFQRRWAEP